MDGPKRSLLLPGSTPGARTGQRDEHMKGPQRRCSSDSTKTSLGPTLGGSGRGLLHHFGHGDVSGTLFLASVFVASLCHRHLI